MMMINTKTVMMMLILIVVTLVGIVTDVRLE